MLNSVNLHYKTGFFLSETCMVCKIAVPLHCVFFIVLDLRLTKVGLQR